MKHLVRALVPVLILLSACHQPQRHDPAARPDVAGCENVWRLSERVYSGGDPRGEEGFRALAALGVQTILSVDGATPDLETARKCGLRYVHLPIGYDGIPRARALSIARAVRDLPGPIYVHCHHGKHRGPAAAAMALVALGEVSAEQGASLMERAGTSETYWGLYADVRGCRATQAEIDAADSSFPEKSVVSGLTATMTAIDERWERLSLAREAGWKTPPDHPDIDPPHEALQIREHFTELARQDAVRSRPTDFQGWLSEADSRAADMEAALRRSDGASANTARARVEDTCKRCHDAYRNRPKDGRDPR